MAGICRLVSYRKEKIVVTISALIKNGEYKKMISTIVYAVWIYSRIERGFSGSVKVSVVKFNKCFSNSIVNVHIHRNLLLDNKRAITCLRWCVYSLFNAKKCELYFNKVLVHQVVDI